MKGLLKIAFWSQLVVILFFWSLGSTDLIGVSLASNMLAAGRLAGLLGVFFVLMQFVLIGRIYLVESVFGHDELTKVHHKFGKYALIFIILHFSLIVNAYALLSSLMVPSQIAIFLKDYDDVLQAFIAYNLFILVVVSSLAIVRLKLRYEAWYVVHLLTYLAVLLAFGHQLKLGGDFSNRLFAYYWIALYILVFGSFIMYRFIRPIYLYHKHRFRVLKVSPETDQVHSFIITGENINSFVRKSGQFFIVRFLDRSRFWQAHPFSLSWSARNSDIRITAKKSGDYTSLVHLIKPGTRVLIEGPLGGFTKNKSKSDNLLFVAAGVGITPIRSLIEDLAVEEKDMILLYSNKTSREIVFSNELNEIQKKSRLKIVNIITEEEFFKGEKGRIDEEKIKRLVPDLLSREVYLCGPGGFMDAVIIILTKLGVPKNQIHFEKFSFH